MDESTLRKILSNIPLGGLRIFDQIGSTNDIALAWAVDGAPDMALVYAEGQTSGRGRAGHLWFTSPGMALAFSLVLRPLPGEEGSMTLFSGLGAMAVCDALEMRGLNPEIKWPNDILLNGCKVCGILTEAVWMGEKAVSIILGIGLNVKPGAVPPPEKINFPATSLETELGKNVDRVNLLTDILQALLHWRALLITDVFSDAWEDRLAYRGQQVEIQMEGSPPRTGQVDGLERDGSLRLHSQEGHTFTVQFGEMHLRPVL
jgi:BirA family biotin operon repressor/biotin-[acetyl-CoA-carboxylase] ligase